MRHNGMCGPVSHTAECFVCRESFAKEDVTPVYLTCAAEQDTDVMWLCAACFNESLYEGSTVQCGECKCWHDFPPAHVQNCPQCGAKNAFTMERVNTDMWDDIYYALQGG